MKKPLLILFLVSLFACAEAQIVNIDTVKTPVNYKPSRRPLGQNEYNYSIGLKLLSIQQLPKLLKQTNETKFYNSSFNGLIFKFNDNQISYRIFADFLNQSIEFKNECEDCEITSGKVTDYALKIGFEKNVTYSRLQPYYGADIGFRGNNFKGSSKNAGAVNFTAPYDVKTSKKGAELTPFVGLKLNIINQLTFTAESAFALFVSYETQEKMFRDAARTRTFQKYNKTELLLKPLNILSLQYNLGGSD